jgi:hypothetical protein
MRLAEVTKEVSNHLNEVSERYQVPQRLRVVGDTARRGAQNAYQLALEHPRTSAAAGVILAAAIVGGVLWYMFGSQREPLERRTRRVRAGTGRKRAKTTRASRAAAA